MKLNLWLDDVRSAPTFIESGLVWTVAKTADEAIELLRSGNIEFASLDHDLAQEHYDANKHSLDFESQEFKAKTGWDVMTWMTENNVWPKNGVRIHTGNGARRAIMLSLVEKVYGRTFQYGYGWVGSEGLSNRAEAWSEEEDAVSTNTY
jgi:hypothetical protein